MDIDKLTAGECQDLILKLQNRIYQYWKDECIATLKRRGFAHAEEFAEGHDGLGYSVWGVKNNNGFHAMFERSLEATYNRLCKKDQPTTTEG